MLKKVVYYFQQYLQWVIPQRQSWGCWELEDPSGEAPSETFRDGREDFPSEENLQTWELPLPSSHRAGLWHRPGEGCQRYPAFKLHPLRLPATQADQPQTGTLLLGHRLGRHPRYVEHQGCFYTSPFSFQLIIVSTGGKENVSLAEALNQARLPIIDFTTCKQKKFWGDRVQDSMICAGFKDTGDPPAACQVRLMTVCKWTNTGLNHWADTYRYKSRRKYNLYFSRDFLFQLLLCCL